MERGAYRMEGDIWENSKEWKTDFLLLLIQTTDTNKKRETEEEQWKGNIRYWWKGFTDVGRDKKKE